VIDDMIPLGKLRDADSKDPPRATPERTSFPTRYASDWMSSV
jgi:hypothetical protein